MASTWQADLGFADRLSAVNKIASAEQDSNPLLPAVQSRREATLAETDIYKRATSLEDYHQRCAGKVRELLNAAPEPITPDDDTEFVPTPDAIDVGKYKNACYHREGLFSVVFKAAAVEDVQDINANPAAKSRLVALKVTTPSMMEAPHDSRREAEILRLSSSSNVIPLVETFRYDGSRFVIVFPYMSLELNDLLHEKKLSKPQIRQCLKDMFTALAHIHSRSIIHRDVKPSNILLKSLNGPAYLSDFGIAWAPDAPGSETADDKVTDVGTTCYRPPELLFGNKRYGCSLDLWAAGCTVAEAIDPDHATLFDSGELGSDLALVQSIFMKLGTPTLDMWPEAAHLPDWGKIQFREYARQTWDSLLPASSDFERDLVSKLVQYESGARMTAEEALRHPYFLLSP